MKIKGLTAMYLAALSDSNNSLHSLVKTLATLDPSFSGKYFEYIPQDVDLFLGMIDLTTAIEISQANGIVEFSGYPIWVTASDKTAEVPAFFPSSVYYADDDLENETPLQKTFEQWVLDQNHTIYEYSGGFFAGNFHRHGLDFAQQVIGAVGFGLMEHSEAVAELASESVE